MINLFKNLFIKFNKNIKQKLMSGFSIIEIIIYFAIFTALSILVINSFIIVLSSFSTIRTNHDLLDSGSVAMDRISHEIRKAQNVDLINSSFDVDSGILRLNNIDGVSYVQFEKTANRLDLLENGVLSGNLLSNNISINKLMFRYITTTNSEAVKIEIELEDTRSKIPRIEKFYNTVVLRGGYQK